MTIIKTGPSGDWCRMAKACTSHRVKPGELSNSSSSITAGFTRRAVIYSLRLAFIFVISSPLVKDLSPMWNFRFIFGFYRQRYQTPEIVEENCRQLIRRIIYSAPLYRALILKRDVRDFHALEMLRASQMKSQKLICFTHEVLQHNYTLTNEYASPQICCLSSRQNLLINLTYVFFLDTLRIPFNWI